MKLIYLLLFALLSSTSFAQEMTPQDKASISNFIEAIKSKDLVKLMPHISFPIKREFPLPDIKNEVEFIYRYNELFDDSITKVIANSNVDKDWSKVGWRGFMLHNGDVWIQEVDYKLSGLNLQSKAEREKRMAIIKHDKATIYPAIKDYESPVMVIQTGKRYVRIDEMKDEVYRASVWPANASTSAKPELILLDGTLEYMGSGGNHQYEFKSGEFVYKCQINVVGTEETPPANLIVEKNGAEMMFEAAEIIRN